jgi:endonuclease/exonuclease/phosphatase (EEP) superfamily protein YafD
VPETSDKVTQRQRRRQRLATFARRFTWFVLGASAIGFAGRLFWLFDLLAEFRLQLAASGLVTGLIWLVRKRWLLGGAGLAALGLNLIAILPLYHRDRPVPESGTEFRLVQANLFYKNRSVPRIQSFLQAEHGDIVCLYEFSGDQAALLPWLEANYPFHADAPLIGDAKSSIYSKFPLTDIQLMSSKYTLRTGVRCTADIHGQLVDFLVVHPTIPLYPGAADGRNGQLEEVATLAESRPHPVIMVGDFNITPFSAFYPPRSHPRLLDLDKGFGPLPSFPLFAPPLMVPIDHLFATEEFSAKHRRLGRVIGSDHLPVVTDIVMSPR